uniref:F-box protein 25 n=1 Tax=Myotis myotis TaxID=51298 RepID=A0A7J7Z3Y8_MYOMY|nr:F-box protein 25 [Myotis myotis]
MAALLPSCRNTEGGVWQPGHGAWGTETRIYSCGCQVLAGVSGAALAIRLSPVSCRFLSVVVTQLTSRPSNLSLFLPLLRPVLHLQDCRLALLFQDSGHPCTATDPDSCFTPVSPQHFIDLFKF